MKPHERIIVALDVPTLGQALELVDQLSPHVGFFKVGLELATAVGAPQVVRAITERSGKVFLDLKFNDIPNTVAGASKAAAALGVHFFDVHASAGQKGLEAAVQNALQAKVLVITVLTSFDDVECLDVFGVPCADKVSRFASMASDAGCHGIVCSSKELVTIKAVTVLRHLTTVVPGIRPAWAATGDQKRFTTPAGAITAGADFLVIGRPITKPPTEIGTPVDAAKRIAEEIATALAARSA